MVNTGKPSGGCKLCRARRIKCDETKPFCLKCQKSKRQCPGYRDPFDGKIRDETQSTIRKFKRTRIVIEKEQVLEDQALREAMKDDESDDIKANAAEWKCGFFESRRGSESGNSSTSMPSSTSSNSWEMIHEDFFASLVTPIEQQATCYLLSDYVLVSEMPGGRRGYYKFAYKILTKGDPSRCLLSAFKAVSFVALASRPNSHHLMIEAESHYSRALREVNKAIQDPAQVKSDQTLGAVLLLAFYETLASTRDRLDEYVNHIKGAAQLVRMRGPRQQESDEGAEMFAMTRNQFLAIRSMSPTPERDDYSWLLRQHCGEPYVSRVAKLTIACSEIRMKTDKLLSGGHRDPRKIQGVLELLRTAQAIQKKLSSLDQPQSAVWSVSTVIRDSLRPRDEGEDTPGEVYTFHNLYTAMIYTIIWCSHIFLTTCIFRCMAWLVAPDDWRSGEDYEAAVKATKERIADIVAAVPYCCSWNGSDAEYSDFPVGQSTPASPVKGVAGLVIFRPAFTALVSDYATPEQKKYLQGRMKFLADIVGIKQADILLKTRDESATPSRDIERDRVRE
ncbi:negative acting factor [Diaporthe eres]|uniref:Zn(2)-C6 fungal-type domain-containing protein n=1 Tax=Diaporthe vaccinii TaxID=105482 RepID=A0ABR4EZG6_9PEZI|nr:negative acting factor [Diaporthe eres]